MIITIDMMMLIMIMMVMMMMMKTMNMEIKMKASVGETGLAASTVGKQCYLLLHLLPLLLLLPLVLLLPLLPLPLLLLLLVLGQLWGSSRSIKIEVSPQNYLGTPQWGISMMVVFCDDEQPFLHIERGVG